MDKISEKDNSKIKEELEELKKKRSELKKKLDSWEENKKRERII